MSGGLLKNWRDGRNSNATLKKDETTLQEYMSTTSNAMTACCHKRVKIAIATRTKRSPTSTKLIANGECKKLGSGIAFI